MNFGAQVLSHPLIVEAAETLFISTCVYNNTSGDEDAKIRASFKEPSWNNPVIRYIDHDRNALAPRNGNGWTVGAVATGMVQALKKAGKDAPDWLELLRDEEAAKARVETAIFGMAWFWVGEAEFGLVDGVMGTRAAWTGGREVVEIQYDPKQVTYRALAERVNRKSGWFAVPGEAAQCETATEVFGKDYKVEQPKLRPDREPKYYLLQTPLRHVPMTELQAVRINARIRGDYASLLSPRQLELLAMVRNHPKAEWPVLIGSGLGEGWAAASAVAGQL